MSHLSDYLSTVNIVRGDQSAAARELGLTPSQVNAIFQGRRPCPPRCLKPFIDEFGLDEYAVMKAAAIDAAPEYIKEWLKSQL